MRFENIITDRTWSLFLYTILFVFSITLVVGSPLALDKNETMLPAVVDSSTFEALTPSHQPYLNWTNIKGTPVKVELGRRTNTPTDYGSDYESDDGTNIPDDEHPYGPDDHPPLTVYDFYDSTGYRIELVLQTKRLQSCHINLNVGIAVVLIKVSLFPTRTIGLISIFNGDVTPRLFQRRAGLQQVGCYCAATLIQPTNIPLTISDAEIQDTLDEIPKGIKKSHEGYVYRHGDGKEFGFTPFDLDPNFILEYTLSDWDSDLALRNGDSPAPPSKISHSGNRQYLVPGTEEPYYLEGPESKDRLDELQARYGTLDTAFFGNRKNSKRDVSSDKPSLGVSIWDKNRVLEKGPKDINHVSLVRMGHSVSEPNVEEPTKTIWP
ncbi:hypothetical protein AOL_s00004g375 [Orbilia oligospora ATCC 24927]|uniref:Uncharacterized protein n=1 Tax=Arthrobotrys oligospora (strain ATCC 24927 / CBS 115.81 / DSM 1491) TaxID=756982 RepID=G1WYL5_ARTOA|nr:hypothetical protein AOL_s00004g375 [Orbilia oligospora ATCC 24927]EGX54342.1 hypothetical protein AOL_s00004g375 [Orbilia oligospora ATCC 24927]